MAGSIWQPWNIIELGILERSFVTHVVMGTWGDNVSGCQVKTFTCTLQDGGFGKSFVTHVCVEM